MSPIATRVSVWSTAAILLLGTLALYDHPDFLVSLADQLWSCF